MAGGWIRVSRDRHTPRIRIGGLSLWIKDTSGERQFAAYHPRKSGTWYWYVGFTRRQREIKRIFCFTSREWRRGQWHDYIRVPGGHIIIGRQNYHLERR